MAAPDPPRPEKAYPIPEMSDGLYAELRELASAVVARNPGNSIEATALLHEAYVKVAGGRLDKEFASHSHFFAVSAKAMRHILVDHARANRRLKRGGDRVHVTLVSELLGPREAIDVVALHDLLQRLGELDPRAAQVVDLRFFGGLSTAEIAAVLEVSERTVRGDWSMARAWLGRELGRGRTQS